MQPGQTMQTCIVHVHLHRSCYPHISFTLYFIDHFKQLVLEDYGYSMEVMMEVL